MKTVPLVHFLGINNRLPEHALTLPNDGGQFLKAANNVDVDNAHRVRSRSSMAALAAMTGAHSLFMRSDTAGWLVRAGVLYAITLPAYTEVLVRVLANDQPMTYARFGDDVYCSNGTDRGRLLGTSWFPWGLPTPAEPVLAATAGTLAAGAYQVGVSYYNTNTGEEGGLSGSTVIELASAGGITVALPPAAEGATHAMVYITATNGEVPYLVGTYALGTGPATISARTNGRESVQRYEAPLPAGRVFVSNGRLCSFANGMVYVGIPYRPGYYVAASGFIPFPSTITHAVENQGGTYVCTSTETYWVPGDLGKVEGALGTPLPYGAVPGTGFAHPREPIVGWFSAHGFIVGDPSGKVTAPMAANVDLTPPASGCSTLLVDEFYRVVSCGWCMNLENGAATTYSAWGVTSSSRGYATTVDGIVQLEQDGPIIGLVNFGQINFGVENQKHMPTCYLGVDADRALALRVQTPQGDDYVYDARSAGDLSVQRVDVGRGLRSNWFELSLSNPLGAPFNLASVSFTPISSSRRIA